MVKLYLWRANNQNHFQNCEFSCQYIQPNFLEGNTLFAWKLLIVRKLNGERCRCACFFFSFCFVLNKSSIAELSHVYYSHVNNYALSALKQGLIILWDQTFCFFDWVQLIRKKCVWEEMVVKKIKHFGSRRRQDQPRGLCWYVCKCLLKEGVWKNINDFVTLLKNYSKGKNFVLTQQNLL